MLLPFNEFRRILTALSKSLTLEQAKDKATKGKPWEILVTNTQDGSYKFWKAEGSRHVILPPDNLTLPPVKITWGRIEGPERSVEKNWAYVEKSLPSKLRKGYVYGMPEPGNSPQDKAKKAAVLVNRSLQEMLALADGFRKMLPHIWKDFARISKKHDLDLQDIQEAAWRDAVTALEVVHKSLTSQKKWLEKKLKVELLALPNFVKIKKPKPLSGKRKTNANANATQDLAWLYNQLYRSVPLVKNYWNNADSSVWDWNKIYADIDPSDKLTHIMEEASMMGAEVEYRISSWLRTDDSEWEKLWTQRNLQRRQ